MSWAEIKHALNSSLGTENFESLDKITKEAIEQAQSSIKEKIVETENNIKNESYDNFYESFASYVTAFGDNNGKIIIVPKVEKVEEDAYKNNTTAKVILIPSTVKEISKGAFQLMQYTKIYLPYALEKIGDFAFEGNQLVEEIKIPQGVNYIGKEAFGMSQKVKNIEIPPKIKKILSHSFISCGALTDIKIPDLVEEIGESAFAHCVSLKSVTIGSSVKIIGKAAFFNCSSLTDVYYNGTQSQWNQIEIDNAFDENDPLMNATIHYLKG